MPGAYASALSLVSVRRSHLEEIGLRRREFRMPEIRCSLVCSDATASGLETQQRDNGPSQEGHLDIEGTGMIGFDIACESARSGPRMQGYLVNDLCKNIIADANRNDFALAA
jgi:hypothetical protein